MGKGVPADIIIVGLGPVGAVAASLAGAAGFDVLVLERDPAPFPQPRAIVFDAEIMRVFDSIGLADEIAKVTKPLGGSVYIGADRRPIRTFRSPGPAFPGAWAPSNLFYQPQLEALLRQGLKRFPNVEVRTGSRATGVEIASDAAVVTARAASGEETRHAARFVLACDGASSAVRKSLSIGLDDIGFEERWLVLDAHMRGPMRWPEGYELPEEVRDGRFSLMVCDPAGPATIIPGRGDHRRWEYMLMPEETDSEAVLPDRLRERLSVWTDPDDVEVVRSAVYRFRALIAREWRQGPVFLMGDAAHQTPPFFGQGMCHGIRDAAQLMWKLKLVADGRAAPTLLDSYQPEREPHVRAVIAASVQAGAAVCITDPARATARDAEFRHLEAARAGKPVAMTDVVPPLRAGIVDPDTGGARLPEATIEDHGEATALDHLLDGRPTLLIRSSASGLPNALARRWAAAGGQVLALADDGLIDHDDRIASWLEARGATAVLVRPDRYVYATARDAAEIAAAVTRFLDQLGVPAPAPALETTSP